MSEEPKSFFDDFRRGLQRFVAIAGVATGFYFVVADVPDVPQWALGMMIMWLGFKLHPGP